jgi:hypothetical protein
MSEVKVHRLQYGYTEGNPFPSVDTGDQQRLSELLNDGWRVISHSVVSAGEVSAGGAVSTERTVAYEAHLLLARG